MYNKALYGHVAWDKTTNMMTVVEDPDPRDTKRTNHGDIQPSAIRIQSYKHKNFGKKYQDAVEQVKLKDHEMSLLKKSKDNHGLMTAQLGSIYDVPIVS